MPILNNTLTPDDVRAQMLAQQQAQQAQAAAARGEWVDPYAQQRAALQSRMQQPQAPAYTPEQVSQRRAQNQTEYETGLLGMLSGDESLGQAGGAVLKNALANRNARVSERGSLDPLSGKFTYSPDFLAAQQQAQLDKMDAGSAGSRERHDRDIREDRNRREMQRERLDAQAQLRGAIDANKKDSQNALQSSRNFTVEDRMADDFHRDTKDNRAVLGAFGNLKKIAEKGDAASDIAFVYSYMKMLDPGSVVREGEFATAQNAAGIPERVRNAYNKSLTGAFLSPEQRADMLSTAGRLASQSQSSYDDTLRSTYDKAGRRGLSGFSVTGQELPRPAAPASVDVGAAARQQQPQAARPVAPGASSPNRVVKASF